MDRETFGPISAKVTNQMREDSSESSMSNSIMSISRIGSLSVRGEAKTERLRLFGPDPDCHNEGSPQRPRPDLSRKPFSAFRLPIGYR
jgi:hypothetical protein